MPTYLLVVSEDYQVFHYIVEMKEMVVVEQAQLDKRAITEIITLI